MSRTRRVTAGIVFLHQGDTTKGNKICIEDQSLLGCASDMIENTSRAQCVLRADRKIGYSQHTLRHLGRIINKDIYNEKNTPP